MQLKAALMNDTGGGWHFGCDRVMRVIESNLAMRGISVCARSGVGNKWWEDAAFLKDASAADIIVINGEGTLHHARPKGESLLRVVDHLIAQDKPVALINALYQENPPDWRRYLDKLALISPRDSWSAATLSELTGKAVSHVPDLSMAEGFHPEADTAVREWLTIGESVLKGTAKDLVAFADDHPESLFLPLIRTLHAPRPNRSWPVRQMRQAYASAHTYLFRIRRKNTLFSQDEFEFARNLARSYLHISGRFHAICIAVTTKTPFLALTSNAWKIEALMEDLGIDRWRIVKADVLEELAREPAKLNFGAEERARIAAALERGVAGTAKMFDELAKLADKNHGVDDGRKYAETR
jgi:hypothetical protein